MSIEIILASQSPRRKELLMSLGINFRVQNIECDEIYPQDLKIKQVALYIAEKKNNAYTKLKDNQLLITADTVVICDQKVIGKPKNKQEALEMLQNLSDKTHSVHTAVCMRFQNKIISRNSSSDVDIAFLSKEEIEYYVENYTVLDKAGAYGIQDWLGLAKIKEIKGSYYGIMGLPTDVVYEMLTDFGVKMIK